MPIKDLTNQRFDKLVAFEIAGRDGHHVTWRCNCDCGGVAISRGNSLVSGNTKSCGCLLKNKIKHGMTGTKVYFAYWKIKSICLNPRDPKFENHGGRGIKMFPEWQNDFTAFYDYVGEPPDDKHWLRRIDKNGDFCPGNLGWVMPSWDR